MKHIKTIINNSRINFEEINKYLKNIEKIKKDISILNDNIKNIDEKKYNFNLKRYISEYKIFFDKLQFVSKYINIYNELLVHLDSNFNKEKISDYKYKCLKYYYCIMKDILELELSLSIMVMEHEKCCVFLNYKKENESKIDFDEIIYLNRINKIKEELIELDNNLNSTQ